MKADERRRRHEEARAAVREAVKDGDIGWTARGGAGTAYRWWTSETTHRPLDQFERRALLDLLAADEARLLAGWRPHRGVVIDRSNPDWNHWSARRNR